MLFLILRYFKSFAPRLAQGFYDIADHLIGRSIALITKALYLAATGFVFSFHVASLFLIASSWSSKFALDDRRAANSSSGTSIITATVGLPISATKESA